MPANNYIGKRQFALNRQARQALKRENTAANTAQRHVTGRRPQLTRHSSRKKERKKKKKEGRKTF
eukprot:669339-Rhodomonas_salina.1